MPIKASILIVKYRAVPKCLPYLPSDAEILIRDNSNDNIGFAKAVNQLLSDSKSNNIVLLNPDTVPIGNWLDRLIATAESDPRIGIVQPKLLQSNGLLDSTGHEPDRFLYHDRGQDEPDMGQYDSTTELPSATFACALIKRRVFDTVGKLDPKMFLYYEDVDFSLRARKAGWRIVYEPRAKVIHDRGRHRIPSASVNMLRIYVKNRWWRKILWWHFNTALGVAAGVKNRDLQYLKEKLGNFLHFQNFVGLD